MGVKEDWMSAPRPKSPRTPHKTEVTQPTMITLHNTRPLRERGPPKFFGESLLTKAITVGSNQVNAVGTARNTSDEDIGKQPDASSNFVQRTVNRSRGGGNTVST